MKAKKIAVILGVVVLVISVTLAGCSGANNAAAQAEATMEPVIAEEKIVAEGKVVPLRNATLSFVSGGVVDDIFVEEGETVDKDAVIAQLSGSERLASQISSAELALISAQQAYDDLFENVDVQKAQAELAVAQAKIALEDAEDERGRKDYRRSSDTTLDGIRADAVLAADALKNAEDYYNYFEENYAEDDPNHAAALSQLVAVKKANDKAQYNLNYALGYPEANDVEEADAKVAVALANLEEAQRDLDALQDGKPDEDDVALVEARLKEAQANYDAASASLEDIKLIAPFDGELVSNNLKIGEFVSPGVPAAVIGDVSEWEIETTDLTELDVVNIRDGMEVIVELDALPDLQLKGVVSSVKMLGENVQGDITYTVKVRLEETDERMTWNMTAFVTFPLD
ncbi:MAG: efflux RND transporter periplasmic adaptor subunit [Anaerolineaceae bacterium]|nr:efflux RND transporter periplasmic adaptor subunit [Anaerolineaceae bacterium]